MSFIFTRSLSEKSYNLLLFKLSNCDAATLLGGPLKTGMPGKERNERAAEVAPRGDLLRGGISNCP